MYAVKEIFLSIQGEGANVGLAFVFCRFAGCNLWDGQEESRAGARCNFCDTDFTGGRKIGLDALMTELAAFRVPRVLLTGGEPSLQVDAALILALKSQGFYIAIETNGSRLLPAEIDWICVSPKQKEFVVTRGDELKLVYPQQAVSPADVNHMAFKHFLLQPKDGIDFREATEDAVNYCLRHPQWRLSAQVHKYIGLR